MKQIIPVNLGDDTFVFVEIDPPEVEDAIDIGLPEIGRKAKETFATALDHVLPVADMMVRKLRSLSSDPEQVEVTFGVNVGVETTAFIASSAINANFSVRIAWIKSS
jgi:Trypsin-co-occurring domain 1